MDLSSALLEAALELNPHDERLLRYRALLQRAEPPAPE